MTKTLQWILGIGVILVVTAVVFSTAWPLLAMRAGWTGGYGMMQRGHMFGGMLGGFGMPAFGLGMFWLPLIAVSLITLGFVWLVRSRAAQSGAQPPAAGWLCDHCGKPLQADWQVCPYCGEKK